MAKDPNKIQQAIDQTRGRVSDAKDALVKSDTASALKSTLSSGADKVSDVTGKVRERLPDVAPIANSVQSPIGLVIGFAAAGVIAGLALPLTDFERERLEPIGGDLAQRAIGARDEILEQGRQVVAETVSAARESVQKHGQDLASTLGGTAGEAEESDAKSSVADKPQGAASSSSGSSQPPTSSGASKAAPSSNAPPSTQSAPSSSASQSGKAVPQASTGSSSSANAAAGGTSTEVTQAAQRLSDVSNTRDALQKSGIIKPPNASST